MDATNPQAASPLPVLKGMPRLTLVMPVRGEGVRVIPAISTLAFTIRVPFELLVVYDREDEPTVSVVRGFEHFFPNMRLVRNTRSGVVGAIRTGFDAAVADVVGVWVSYHVDPFGLVNDMFLKIEQGCDLVSGNRFNRIKRVSRGNPIKKLLSRAGNWTLNRLIGVPLGDITTSMKLYRKSFLKENPIETTSAGGWALSTELAVKAAIQGRPMAEVEFLPQNVNMIHGVTNFRVFGQLDQYLKWLWVGIKNRKRIRSHYDGVSRGRVGSPVTSEG